MVVNAEVNQTNKTTLRSARRSVVENSLTGPTLLEMSDKRYPTGSAYRTVQFFSASPEDGRPWKLRRFFHPKNALLVRVDYFRLVRDPLASARK